MVRSMFFAMGLFTLSWGATFLLVDKMVLNMEAQPDSERQDTFRGVFTSTNEEKKRVFDPPDWAAFSLISLGAVTMLYSAALPHKA